MTILDISVFVFCQNIYIKDPLVNPLAVTTALLHFWAMFRLSKLKG